MTTADASDPVRGNATRNLEILHGERHEFLQTTA